MSSQQLINFRAYKTLAISVLLQAYKDAINYPFYVERNKELDLYFVKKCRIRSEARMFLSRKEKMIEFYCAAAGWDVDVAMDKFKKAIDRFDLFMATIYFFYPFSILFFRGKFYGKRKKRVYGKKSEQAIRKGSFRKRKKKKDDMDLR